MKEDADRHWERTRLDLLIPTLHQRFVEARKVGSILDQANALKVLGNALIDADRTGEALLANWREACLRRELGDYPGAGGALYLVGACCESLNRETSAARAYRMAIDLAHHSNNTHIALLFSMTWAEMLERQSKFQESLTLLTESLNQTHGDEKSLIRRRLVAHVSDLHERLGHLSESIGWLEAAIRMPGWSRDAITNLLNVLAWRYQRAGRSWEALEVMKEAEAVCLERGLRDEAKAMRIELQKLQDAQKAVSTSLLKSAKHHRAN